MNMLEITLEWLESTKRMRDGTTVPKIAIFHDEEIKKLEADLQFYESDEIYNVFLVRDLNENPTYYRDFDSLRQAVIDYELESGMGFSVEVVAMTGREFGQLEYLDL